MRYVVTLGDRRPDLDPGTEEAVIRIGELLWEGRRRAGLSQRQLASRTGVDQATISRLERGLTPFSRLALVARLFAELDLFPGDAESRP